MWEIPELPLSLHSHILVCSAKVLIRKHRQDSGDKRRAQNFVSLTLVGLVLCRVQQGKDDFLAILLGKFLLSFVVNFLTFLLFELSHFLGHRCIKFAVPPLPLFPQRNFEAPTTIESLPLSGTFMTSPSNARNTDF